MSAPSGYDVPGHELGVQSLEITPIQERVPGVGVARQGYR